VIGRKRLETTGSVTIRKGGKRGTEDHVTTTSSRNIAREDRNMAFSELMMKFQRLYSTDEPLIRFRISRSASKSRPTCFQGDDLFGLLLTAFPAARSLSLDLSCL
jgi:hypothetical protein